MQGFPSQFARRMCGFTFTDNVRLLPSHSARRLLPVNVKPHYWSCKQYRKTCHITSDGYYPPSRLIMTPDNMSLGLLWHCLSIGKKTPKAPEVWTNIHAHIEAQDLGYFLYHWECTYWQRKDIHPRSHSQLYWTKVENSEITHYYFIPSIMKWWYSLHARVLSSLLDDIHTRVSSRRLDNTWHCIQK